MAGFAGRRIGLLEARRSGEMATLVQRQGGAPVSAPAMKESPSESGEQAGALIDELSAGRIDAAVFLTGAGFRALVTEAEKLGRGDELLDGLRRVQIAARGPKPVAAMRERGLPVAAGTVEPHTTHELLAALASLDLAGQSVAVVHYGERSDAVVGWLAPRCARVTELCLYEWQMPADTEPLQRLVDEVIAGRVDAVAFTTQVQVRHLFAIAAQSGREAELAHALNSRTVVASIGPTCSAALVAAGVTPVVTPEHPKMGHLVTALAAHFANVPAGFDPGDRPRSSRV